MTSGESFRLDASLSPRVTAVELVRRTLRAAIIRGDLPGDSELVQTEIASQLGVSTTPVREAMRDLASEGLIAMDSHRVGIVRNPDWDEMVEIVEIRRSLVEVATRRAMENITEAEMSQARALADDLSKEQDVGPWVENNINFHMIFHEATRTARLSSILATLEEAGGVFVAQAQQLHPEIRRRAIAEHYSLIEAYEKGDVGSAVAIQHSHINHPLTARELDSRSS